MARIRISDSLEEVVRLESVGMRMPRRRRKRGAGRGSRLRRFAGETKRDEVTILKDVSFHLRQGESLAILSRRDIEQETTLRLAAGTLIPDEGHVIRSQSIVPMIRVAAAFGSGFTIRQNIYVVGGLLGMTIDEVRELLPGIAEFAGVDQIVDKYLSNAPQGARLRLAWALSTAVPARAFAIHHCLVVGDREFRQRCWTRMDTMREDGASFLLTSSSIKQFRRFCDRAVLIDAGTVVGEGDVGSVIQQYRSLRKATPDADAAVDGDDDEDSLG